MTDSRAEPVLATSAPRAPDEAWSHWMRRRLARHLPELIRLALPAMASRIGMILMAFVDTVMVGRYGTRDLAALTLANQSLIIPLLVTGVGLLLGVLVHAAQATGRGDEAAVGRIFWRNIPYALVIGLIMIALCLPAEQLFLALGQPDRLAEEAAPLVWVMALGLPGNLLFYVAGALLEGVKRPQISLYAVLIANLANIVLNAVLIFGLGPIEGMGALGSAWATTAVRWLLAIGVLIYLLKTPAMARFRLDQRRGDPWASWADQRRLGYAAAISLAAELVAFGALAIIAGLVSTATVAAFGITFNAMTLPFMLAAGTGSAASVRVSIAYGRDDKDDTHLAGWTGLALSVALILPLSLLISGFPEQVFWLYSDDASLLPIAVPLISLILFVLPFDGGQMTMSMALRGLGDTWWPTGIQIFSYLGVMIPLSYWLTLSIGPVGLMYATLIASVVSVGLLSLRFRFRASRVGEPLLSTSR